MITGAPSISVVVPVFNSEPYLGSAIESVRTQTYSSFEIIVVDDGSNDGTERIARSFGDKVRYFRQSHAGVATARNQGVRLSSGDLVAFLDADDLWEPRKLELQVRAFEADPALDFVLTHVSEFVTPEISASELRVRPPAANIVGCIPSAILINRESFLRVGSFRPDLPVAEWLDWYSRAQESGLRSVTLPEILVKRRLHNASLGTHEASSRGEYARALKAALDRRRKASNPAS